MCLLFELFCTDHSHQQVGRGSVFTFFSHLTYFRQNWTSISSSGEYFPQQLVKGVCQTLSTEQLGPVQARGGPTEWKRQTAFSFLGSSLVIDNDTYPPPPQPNRFSCVVPPSPFFPVTFSVRQRSQGLRLSNRDCACLRLSRSFEVGSYPSWAIQPSILAWYRLQSGQRCYEGRRKITGCGFSFISSKHLSRQLDCPLSNKQPTLLYSTAQEMFLTYFWQQFTSFCLRGHAECPLEKNYPHMELNIISSVMVFYCSSWND